MITLVATAHCGSCEWTAGPATLAEVDRAADKHASPAHPTTTVAEPARKAPETPGGAS